MAVHSISKRFFRAKDESGAAYQEALKAARKYAGQVHRKGVAWNDISITGSGNSILVELFRRDKNPAATKKKKKKAKRPATKRVKSKGFRMMPGMAGYKGNSRNARIKSNPGAKLKAKIAQMKPGFWYKTTLSGARVKVQRKGNSLVIRPASKKRSR